MNKDFSQKKLLSFDPTKQIKILFDLAHFIEKDCESLDNTHFQKLKKYHEFLNETKSLEIKKLNKEFSKIQKKDYQFQIYLMNLERILGQSTKEYEFIVQRNDSPTNLAKKINAVCILDSVRSAHNIGAIIRTSECFGVKKLFLTGLSPTPESVHVKKTAMGCEEFIDWVYSKNTITTLQQCKKEGFKIIGIETAKESHSLFEYNFNPENQYAFVFGHEQFGLSLDVLNECDEILSIPLTGVKNSLNVSICHGIVFSQFSSNILKNSV